MAMMSETHNAMGARPKPCRKQGEAEAGAANAAQALAGQRKGNGGRKREGARGWGQPTGGCKNLAGRGLGERRARLGQCLEERRGGCRRGRVSRARPESHDAHLVPRRVTTTGSRGCAGGEPQRTSQAGVKPHTRWWVDAAWCDAMRCDAMRGAWSRGAREALAQGRTPNRCYPVQSGQARPTHKTVQRGPSPTRRQRCHSAAEVASLGFRSCP